MNAILWTADHLPKSGRSKQRTQPPRQQRTDGRPDPYFTVFSTRVKRRTDLRRATELALPQLMPLAVETLTIYARRHEDGVELAAFRKADLQIWERSAKARGHLFISENWSALSPGALDNARRQRLAIFVAGLCSIASAIWLGQVWLAAENRNLASLLTEEQHVRSAALTAARKRDEADLGASLKASFAQQRLPGSVLAAVTELSRETPDGAFWTQLDWTPTKTVIAGSATDPLAVLESLSKIKGNSSAQFSKPLTAGAVGRQSFEIQLTPAGTKE